METKVSVVRERMAAGDWPKAIALAAKFPRLGEHRDAITRAHMAITNPAFVRGIRKDPDALIEAGKAALIDRYSAPRATACAE